jgi:hypothetical protein
VAVREFLDTEAGFKASGSFEAVFNGPHTLVKLFKPLAVGAGANFATFRGGTDQLASLSDGGSGRLAYFTQTEDVRAAVGLTANEWQLVGWSKDVSTDRPRAHRQVLGGAAMTHVTPTIGDAIAYKSAALAEIRIGEFAHQREAVVAIIPSALSDSDWEAIGATLTSQLLVDLGAIHLWNFNQASTGTAIQDLIGSAHQTTISSGTIAVTGDDPPGWNFAVTVTPPLSFTLQLSGGADNTDPALSIGGEMSTHSPGADLFDDVTESERSLGLQDYRLVYVHNADVADGNAVIYVPTQLESGRELAVGWAAQGAGGTVTAPANDHTAPAGVAFSAPSSLPAGVSSLIPAGSFRGLWVRRTVNSNTPQDPTNLGAIEIKVLRVA